MVTRTVRLCAFDVLADPGAKGFSPDPGEEGTAAGFVVRKGRRAFAYWNRCPHTGAPLEWVPDQFLDHEHRFIQCSLHGPLFRIETGQCLHGPCVGQALQALALRIRRGVLYVEVPESPGAPL